jgi:cytochrome o ubiquinol oxidase subunit 3
MRVDTFESTAGAVPAFYLADEPDHAPGGSTLLGFWIYLMSDCLIFAVLFACFGVYGGAYAGGPGPRELFALPTVAINTALLLFSSITFGLAMLAMQRGRVLQMQAWLAATGLLGATFVGIELREFSHLIGDGAGPQRSAFLSSFFTLVGTHGLHVSVGLI